MNDKHIKKAIKKELIQSPASGFADQVMDDIFKLPTLSITPEYTPIITKKMWAILGTGFVTFICIITGLVLNGNDTEAILHLEMPQSIESFFTSIIPLHFVEWAKQNLILLAGLSVMILGFLLAEVLSDFLQPIKKNN